MIRLRIPLPLIAAGLCCLLLSACGIKGQLEPPVGAPVEDDDEGITTY